MTLQRRTVLKGILGAGASAFALKAPAIAQATPFKIGLLTVKTGPLAQGGIQMEQGIATLLKEKGNTLADRKIEFISADTGGNPAGAKTKAQELIERDKVNVILGPLAAFELLAITDYVRDNQTPLISLAAAEDVTQRKANPFVIRPSATSAQCCHAMGDYAAKELKYKRAATISEDFAFGYEQMSGFQRVFAPDLEEIVFQGALDPHTPVAQGWLRASHRKLDRALSTPYRPYHTHDDPQPLRPEEIVELDIEIWPTSIVVPQGHRIGLSIRGRDYEHPGPPTRLSNMKKPMTGCGPFMHDDPIDRPADIFGGRTTLHFGGGREPHLLLPVVPSKRPSDR